MTIAAFGRRGDDRLTRGDGEDETVEVPGSKPLPDRDEAAQAPTSNQSKEIP